MKYYEILRLRIILVFLNSFQENPKKKKKNAISFSTIQTRSLFKFNSPTFLARCLNSSVDVILPTLQSGFRYGLRYSTTNCDICYINNLYLKTSKFIKIIFKVQQMHTRGSESKQLICASLNYMYENGECC